MRLLSTQSTHVLDVLQSELAVRQPCSDMHSCPRHQGLALDPVLVPQGVCDVAQGAGTGSASERRAAWGPLNTCSHIISSAIRSF